MNPLPTSDDPTHVHDLVGIGLGPANLGLACLVDPIDEIDAVFLESGPDFAWHPGMLLEQSTLQTPFMGDLVTMADPTSPYSFLNYLKEVGRLYPFYIRESFYPLRAEFDDYCRWAAHRVGTVRFSHHVQRVDNTADGHYVVVARTDDGLRHVRGRRLALGVGTQPFVPESLREPGRGDGSSGGGRCGAIEGAVHSADYLAERERLRACSRVTVVGSGQSAAEIVQDLLSDRADGADGDRELVWLTRSPRFFPLELTELTLEMTSPDYTGYFHSLPPEKRDDLLSGQGGLYKGISSETIEAIYELLYARGRTGPPPVRLLTNSVVTGARRDAGRFALTVEHTEQRRRYALETDGLVLATGYRSSVPEFLAPLADRIARDRRGRYAVRRNYTVETPAAPGSEIFVQNGEEHTHGFVAPDLGMTAYRNSWLIRTILGREHYPIEESVAFQDFGAPTDGFGVDDVLRPVGGDGDTGDEGDDAVRGPAA